MHRRWLQRMAQTDSLDAIRLERDVRTLGEYHPPRLTDVETVDRAAAMAERFMKSFLRLLKAYRDQRRLFDTLVVAGGQVNIAADGGQQVVATRTIRSSPASRPRANRASLEVDRGQRPRPGGHNAPPAAAVPSHHGGPRRHGRRRGRPQEPPGNHENN